MTDTNVLAVIPAEVHTDDHVIGVKFDAVQWFQDADSRDIQSLAECGWGGDYPADAVAQYLVNFNPEIERLFNYLHAHNSSSVGEIIGFEVQVDEQAALSWLVSNRPDVHELL